MPEEQLTAEEKKKQKHLLENSIFKRRTYDALPATQKAYIKEYFENAGQNTQKSLVDDLAIVDSLQSISESVQIYTRQLTAINPATFRFLDSPQRKQLEQDLQFAFYVFSSRFQWLALIHEVDEEQLKPENLDQLNAEMQGLRSKITTCAKYISTLRFVEAVKKGDLAAEMERAIDDSEKHLKYLGVTLAAPILVKLTMGITGGDIFSVMSEMNMYRLYWVWARAFIDGLLGLFITTTDARVALAMPSPVTGYMSWVLYYLRGGFHLGLLLKHTLAGPWISKRESDIPWYQRFKTQWAQRKFNLLNDLIWATANLACFFWLIGDGVLGWWGNVLTAVLLLMDLSLTIWRFAEEQTKHEADKHRYETEYRELNTQINNYPDDPDIMLWKRKLKAIERDYQKCISDWRFKEKGLYYDLTYAFALLMAFSMLCCFFFPPAAIAPLTLTVLGVAGAAMCFLLTAIYSSMSAGINISKTQYLSDMAQEDYNCAVKNFAEEKTKLLQLQQQKDSEELQAEIARSENILRQLYLDILQFEQESIYQKNLIPYQRIELIHSTLINLIIPPLVFSALMFLPLGFGLEILAVCFVLAFISIKYFENYTRFAPSRIPDEHFKIELCDDKPTNITTDCFFLYIKNNVLQCTFKNLMGVVENLEFSEAMLGEQTKAIKAKFETKQPLNQEERKTIFDTLATKGYNFDLPTFDQKAFDDYLNSPLQAFDTQHKSM